MTTTEFFRKELHDMFNRAMHRNEPHVTVKSGDLHSAVGDYPGHDHRMPLCCKVMRDEMGAEDKIVDSPPKGDGANLQICYQLPRPWMVAERGEPKISKPADDASETAQPEVSEQPTGMSNKAKVGIAVAAFGLIYLLLR